MHRTLSLSVCKRDGGREGGRDGGREGGTDGGREGRREGRREGGRDGGRDGGREGGTEGGREGRTEGGRKYLRTVPGLHLFFILSCTRVVESLDQGFYKLSTPTPSNE